MPVTFHRFDDGLEAAFQIGPETSPISRIGLGSGFRHTALGQEPSAPSPAARGHERWVINKLRALGSWYTKGLEGGGQLRVAINSSESIEQLRETIEQFFLAESCAI